MPCLIRETDELNKEPCTITLGNESIIGREKSNNIYIDDERASRRHAKITREPDGSFLMVDMGSRNGIVVNGARVSRRKLVDKDRIVVGRTTFVYDESVSGQTVAPNDKTIKAPADGPAVEPAKLGSEALKKAIQDVAAGRPEDKTTLDSKKTALVAADPQKNNQPSQAGGSPNADEAPSLFKRIMIFLSLLIFFVVVLLVAREMTKRLLYQAAKPNSAGPVKVLDK